MPLAALALCLMGALPSRAAPEKGLGQRPYLGWRGIRKRLWKNGVVPSRIPGRGGKSTATRLVKILTETLDRPRPVCYDRE